MTLDKYRLKHLVKQKHRGAVRANRLLQRPDRLIGLILLGNNFVNILASSISTIIALRLYGEAGIAVATGLLTLVILIFAEVTPKTLAAMYPEKIAFPAAFVYGLLLRVFYPLVWLVSQVTRLNFFLLGISTKEHNDDHLSKEELRTILFESSSLIPVNHQNMLINILDLENISVEGVMVPRKEIAGIDLQSGIDEIVEQVSNSEFSQLLVYDGSFEKINGFLKVINLIGLIRNNQLTMESFVERCTPVMFVPETTPLNKLLLQFQAEKRNIALVVDEYGDIKGMVSVKDVLEEIVGQLADEPEESFDIHPVGKGGYLVDASIHVRDVNRALDLSLPDDGPSTLNGLIVEYLETIPEENMSVLIGGLPIEIVEVETSAIKKVIVHTQ